MEMISRSLLALLVAGFTVQAIEDLGEEATTTDGFTDLNPAVFPDNQPSPENPDTTRKPGILDELEQVAWKIVQLEWNLTSAIQKRLGEPLSKAIRMRSEIEPALARVIGLVEGGVLKTNERKLFTR